MTPAAVAARRFRSDVLIHPVLVDDEGGIQRRRGRRVGPGEDTLQIAAGGGVVPLRLGWQEPTVPDAECVELEPIRVGNGVPLVCARRRRPGASGPAALQVSV